MSLSEYLLNWSNETQVNNNSWSPLGITQNESVLPLSYDQTPADLRQYLLIFRLVLLGIGAFDTILLLAVYIKCTGIISSCVGVYVANISIAALIDMLDVIIWSVNEFGYRLEDYELEPWIYSIAKLPKFGLPTTSLFFLLLIIDRFFATCFSGCYKGCYGSKFNAIFLLLLVWLGSFFMVFILVFPDLLFPSQPLYNMLQYGISYIGPFVLKLLLLLILFIKRKMVPDSEQSQALIHRQRESLYYVLTIITLHLLFSAPYYAVQVNHCFQLVQYTLDQWIILLTYALSQVPLVLNPILCLSIDPEFRDSLVFVFTCSGRSRRDMTDLCDDHAESQPLAPMATSPVAEEKEHLDEAESWINRQTNRQHNA